jgi:hypothetical protein
MYETPQPPDDVYDVVPLARSPMTPVQQISLSQGAPSVAGMKPVDRSPLPVYVRMPSALPKRDPRPERRSGEPWNRAYVVINQARKTRDLKIARGVYSMFCCLSLSGSWLTSSPLA